MALWPDATDVTGSFESEVPRRALHEPVLRQAVCAFSARYLNRHSDSGQAKALDHQDKCLQLLIPAISGLQSISDNPKAENVLFTASHALHVWGDTLRRPTDQEAALLLLQDIERCTKWDTARLSDRLKGQWGDDSD